MFVGILFYFMLMGIVKININNYQTLYCFQSVIFYFSENDANKVNSYYSILNSLASKFGFHKFITIGQKYFED